MSKEKELKQLAEERVGPYKKEARAENFLSALNAQLRPFEEEQYQDCPIEHPFFMVIGAPRSGTTFCTQFLANAFRLSYINNLSARFFQNPLTAIRLSEQVLGKGHLPSFQSHYAKTEGIHNIHEFGYFWRHWLHKGSLAAMESLGEDEAKIDWSGLKKVLANMQAEWQNAAVFKNIFGSYHMPKLSEVLEQVIWVYIERDELDAAVSIYGAREKHYGAANLKKWWSYSPPNVMELLDQEPVPQIAGQVHYLKRYYEQELAKLPAEKVFRVDYADLTQKPREIAQALQAQTKRAFGYELELNQALPESFPLNRHGAERAELKAQFAAEFEKLRKA